MQLFLDGGADVVTEYPFTMAFSEKIRTALNRFVVYKRSHPELDLELQEQVDRALRFFGREGNLKWVSLLMWAGGDPEHWLAATRERVSGQEPPDSQPTKQPQSPPYSAADRPGLNNS